MDILGAEEIKRYLILFQNDSEIRATGGFIGSLALIDIKNGEIVNLEVPQGGPYDFKAGFFENIIAPRPLWLINPNFNFWDMNWWPHFPSSANMIIKYFEKSGGPSVDGLIAINSSVMLDFLEVSGPIFLENRNLEINSDNFMREVQEIVEIKDNGEKPKAIIGEILSKILNQFENEDNLEYLSLLKVFNKSVKEKSIQMYFTDNAIESIIDQYGWSGALVDTNKDYLNVVNTNIGGGKTDNSIRQKINHNVNILSNGSIINTLKIKRTFAESDNIFAQTKNRNYMRVYVPRGSKLIEASGWDDFPETEYMKPVYGSKEDEDIINISTRVSIDQISKTQIYDEFNKTVFAGWQEINPGEDGVIYLKYELPFKLDLNKNNSFSLSNLFFKNDNSLNLDNYSVYYQKQSGIKSELESNFTFPNFLDIVWSNVKNNNLNIDLNSDLILGFILEK